MLNCANFCSRKLQAWELHGRCKSSLGVWRDFHSCVPAVGLDTWRICTSYSCMWSCKAQLQIIMRDGEKATENWTFISQVLRGCLSPTVPSSCWRSQYHTYLDKAFHPWGTRWLHFNTCSHVWEFVNLSPLHGAEFFIGQGLWISVSVVAAAALGLDQMECEFAWGRLRPRPQPLWHQHAGAGLEPGGTAFSVF